MGQLRREQGMELTCAGHQELDSKKTRGILRGFVDLNEEANGNWYYSPTYDIEGWLCPALFKYFDEAPKAIYAKAEALPT